MSPWTHDRLVTFFFIGLPVFIPDLLPLNLLVKHLVHLFVKLASTKLDVENLTAHEPLLVAIQNVDYPNSHRDPDDQQYNGKGLEAKITD